MRTRNQLTEAEGKIMQLLWEQSPQTLMELTRALEPETGWVKNTIITLLRRMEEKGTVRVETVGRTRHFYPCVEKSQIASEQTHSLLKRLFGGKATLLVSNLVEQGQLSDGEVDELLRILNEAKNHPAEDTRE